MMNNRMKELEMKEKTSKSLLANVLDIDEDFRWQILDITESQTLMKQGAAIPYNKKQYK